MKKAVFKTLGILMAVSLLASCASMPMATQNSPQPGTQNSAQCAVQKSPPIVAQNSAERKILYQAVTTGGIIGTAAGAGLGAYLCKKNRAFGALIGGLAGGVLGTAIGHEIAIQQIQNLRNIRLKNKQLEELLAKAREYNYFIAAYNHRLREKIAHLRRIRWRRRRRIAREDLKKAEKQRALLKQAIAERQQLSQVLVKSQKVQYQETLTELNKKAQRMDRYIAQLQHISGQVRIGA